VRIESQNPTARENTDGSPLTVGADFFAGGRNEQNLMAGPLERLAAGALKLR